MKTKHHNKVSLDFYKTYKKKKHNTITKACHTSFFLVSLKNIYKWGYYIQVTIPLKWKKQTKKKKNNRSDTINHLA